MTNFGLAAYRPAWRDSLEHHDPIQAPRPALIGTYRYASINGHLDIIKCGDPVVLHNSLMHDRPTP